MSASASSAILAAVLVTLGSLACAEGPKEKLLDLHQAIAVAEQAVAANKVERSGIELVGLRRHKFPHNELVPYKPTTDFQKMLAKKLEGRIYWYVTYMTPSAEMGGEYGVFIDARSGEVIYFYMGR